MGWKGIATFVFLLSLLEFLCDISSLFNVILLSLHFQITLLVLNCVFFAIVKKNHEIKDLRIKILAKFNAPYGNSLHRKN